MQPTSFFRKNFSKIFLIGSLLIAVVLGIIFAYTQLEREKNFENQKTFRIATSIFPVTLFVTNLVSEKVEIKTMIPPGSDIHAYNFTPGDVRTLLDADLLVVLGNGLEPIEGKLITLVNNENKGKSDIKPKIIKLSDGINFLSIDHAEEDEHNEADGYEDKDEHGQFDPHIWLSPLVAINMVKNLEQALIAFDVNDTKMYNVRSTEVISRLNELHDTFKTVLSDCKKDTILVNHNAYGYLRDEYKFNIIAVTGVTVEKEPGPQELVNLIKVAKAKNIRYLFFEENRDSRNPDTIAKELGVTLLPLYSIETKPADKELMSPWGKIDEKSYYFELMELNLRNLATGLECSGS